MPHSILGRVTLGYEPIWNRARHRACTRLWVEPDAHAGVEARHLLATLAELWPASAGPLLLLSVRSDALRDDLLEHPATPGIWLEIQDHWLTDVACTRRVRQAHQRGLPMVWRGEPGQVPSSEVRGWFHQTLRCLTPQEALQALRVSRHRHHPTSQRLPARLHSPVLAGDLYEGLASPALVEHALDQQGAWGVLGWPSEEILHRYRHKPIQPDRTAIQALLQAIDADASLENMAQGIGDEPLLCYRFLRYANSAGLGLQRDIDSVRQGLMALGYGPLRTWLREQLPQASSDPHLAPIRAHMVLRARIMEQLADAGLESDLRREAFLCGIFSQMDWLLGEPTGTALLRLPLPSRVTSAIVGHTGPYAPWLAVATALESGSTRLVREICQHHQMAATQVNRALLRTLAAN